ncbi:MAG TPA: aldose 1-epimerase [Steroidobacteraceae bacterium]
MQLDGDFLVLAHEDTRLTLDAVRGGAVRDFKWRERPIFRPTPRSAAADPFELACFPLVPYANRIASGRFSFGACAVQLKSNWQHDPHPLHGQGWLSPWSVVEAGASSATLMFEGGADEWPWRYRAEQRFRLDRNALSITLAIENLAPSPMPVMLGLHPYFCDAALAKLQARAQHVWLTDEARLPVKQVPTPIEWSFDSARSISAVPLDHCFADWNADAVLIWPDRRVDIHATNCRYLHIYTPPGRDFFCVEPQSAPAGALNRSRDEAAVLQPGERFAMCVDFEIGAG